MKEEITMQHITDAIRYIEKEPTWIIEDKFFKVEMSHLGAKKVTLRPLGRALVDKLMRDTELLGRRGEVAEIFGMKVVVSDKVEGVKLRWKY